MNLIFAAVLLLGLWGIRRAKDGESLSKEQTGAINGFFVLLVFLRHTVDYIRFGPYDQVFQWVDTRLDQLIVAPFLFYSGYGIARSIRAKGHGYVAALPWQRLFKVWYHFALAVGLYLCLALCMGKDYGLSRVALSFTGWSSIGNSNWYIFATLFLYLATWLSFSVLRRNHRMAAVGVAALAVGYILIMRQFKGLWWYDTALVYPAGLCYGIFLEKPEQVKKPWLWALIWAGVFLLCFKLQRNLLCRELMAVAFAMTIVALTAMVRIGNPVLNVLGKYTFEIYILQRLPMIALQGRIGNQYLYLAVCFALTLALSVLFHKALTVTDNWIYQKGRKRT